MAVAEIVKSVLHPDAETEPFLLVQELFNDARAHLTDYHDAMKDELEFSLSLRHYFDDHGNERDKRMVQPHSLDLYHLLRHKAAKINKAQLSISCEPTDEFADPDLAEDCRIALEYVTGRKELGYMSSRRKMVWGALSSRAWCMKVSYANWIRPYGEIVFESFPSWNLFKAPGWTDMHDATCPWVIEQTKPRVQDIKRLAANDKRWDAEGLVSDATMSGGKHLVNGGAGSGDRRQSRKGMPAPGGSGQEAVTLLWCWFRDDPFEEEGTLTSPVIELAGEEKFYECPSCGESVSAKELGISSPSEQLANEPPEAALMRLPPEAMNVLSLNSNRVLPDEMEDQLESVLTPEDMPEVGPPCARCGTPMERQDFVEREYSYLKYPNGRLVVIAPNCGKVVYNDEWPVRARSFPYMEYDIYPHPEDPYGQSDVSLLWTMVLIQDATFLSGWEQLMRNVDIIMTPKDGLVDNTGQPYLFTDEQGTIAYFANPMAASLTKHFQGSGLSAGWPVFLQAIQGSFQKNMGFNDVSLSGPELAQATVGAVQTAEAQGEVPLEDHIGHLNDIQSQFLGVVLDYIIGTWTMPRWLRFAGLDGVVKSKRLSGTDLPYMDVTIEVEPQMDAKDQQTVQAFMQWMGLPPPAQVVLAPKLGISPSMIRKYRQAEMEMAMAAAKNQVDNAERGIEEPQPDSNEDSSGPPQ